MKRWAFVQAMIDHDNDAYLKPGEFPAVCFRQTFVDARDEDEAYALGFQWSKSQDKVSLLNDYVFEV